MKKFKFRFSKLTTGFIWAGIALAVIAAGVNTYFLIADRGGASAVNRVFPILQYSLMYFVAAALLVILISLLISSYYLVDGNFLKTSFGIIKSKYDVNTVTAIELDRTTNKLTAYFENDSFMVIAVKEEWYNDFVDALLEANRKIEFSIKSKENTPDDENKK